MYFASGRLSGNPNAAPAAEQVAALATSTASVIAHGIKNKALAGRSIGAIAEFLSTKRMGFVAL